MEPNVTAAAILAGAALIFLIIAIGTLAGSAVVRFLSRSGATGETQLNEENSEVPTGKKSPWIRRHAASTVFITFLALAILTGATAKWAHKQAVISSAPQPTTAAAPITTPEPAETAEPPTPSPTKTIQPHATLAPARTPGAFVTTPEPTRATPAAKPTLGIPPTTTAATSVAEAEKALDAARQAGIQTDAMVHRSGAQYMRSNRGGGVPQPQLPDRPATRARHYGTNPFYDTDEDPLSTFSLDGDTASFDIALNRARSGALPDGEWIRVEDFVNAMPQGYEGKDEGLAVVIDAAPSPYGPEGYVLARVGIAAPERNDTPRDPAGVILMIDTSGSMDGQPIATAKRAARIIIETLGNEDALAIVEYGGVVRTALQWTDGPALGASADQALAGLHAEGGTPLADALHHAYAQARAHIRNEGPGRPRIIVISDGYGNIGPHDMDAVLQSLDTEVIRATTVTTLGVGGVNYDDVAMETLANRGNGTYHYIGGSEERLDAFAEEAPDLLRDSPRDARVQVEFNPRTVRKYRLIGYENREVADQDFRNDDLDFGEPGFARDVTALYEMRVSQEWQDNPDAPLLTAAARWRESHTDITRETATTLTAKMVADDFTATSEYFRRTAAAAEIAEILRRSPWAGCADGLGASSDLENARIEDRGDAINELVRLMDAIHNKDHGANWRARCRRYGSIYVGGRIAR